MTPHSDMLAEMEALRRRLVGWCRSSGEIAIMDNCLAVARKHAPVASQAYELPSGMYDWNAEKQTLTKISAEAAPDATMTVSVGVASGKDMREVFRQAFIAKGWPEKHTAGELADIAITAMGASGENVERVQKAIGEEIMRGFGGKSEGKSSIDLNAVAKAAIAAMSRDAAICKDAGFVETQTEECEQQLSPASPSEDLVMKPCPFCGASDLYLVVHSPASNPAHESWVHCEVCEATSKTRPTEEKAIESWNRRTTEPVISALNSRLNVAYIHARDIYTITPEEVERHGGYAIVNDCIGHAREIMNSLEAAGVVYVDR